MVWDNFEMKTVNHYHEELSRKVFTYLKFDILLLADVFEKKK